MKSDDYPLDVFVSAIGTTLGWFCTIGLTTYLGVWVGMSVGHNRLESLVAAFWALVLSWLVVFVTPQVLIAYFWLAVAVYVPLQNDSTRIRVGFAIANIVVCALFTLVAVRGFD